LKLPGPCLPDYAGATMRRATFALGALLLALPVAVPAVTLSGVMIYATDQWGTPNAWTGEAFVPGQLWRTQLGGEWYGLGIMPGLPPTNSDEPLFNFPDFSISIPLSEGENDFTLVGEAGPLSWTDRYTHFSINLYFDGVPDHPGISALFPRNTRLDGDAPIPNQSDVIYSLSVAPVRGAPETTYTDGGNTVTVLAVSFLPPTLSRLDYDKVQAQQTIPTGGERPPAGDSGGVDYVGVLKIDVEGLGSSGPIGVFPGPADFGVVPGAGVGPDLSGPVLGAPQPTPGADAAAVPQPAASRPEPTPQQVAAGSNPTPAEAEPTAADLTPTPNATASTPGTTPTPRSTAPTPGRTTATVAATSISTVGVTTPTPGATHAAATPTARAPKTPASRRK